MDSLVICLALAGLAWSPAWDGPPAQPGPALDVHEEMRQLVLEIERTLRGVDGLLWDAQGARERRAAKPDVGELLLSARSGARRAIEQMDRLLELSHHPHPQGGT